MGAYLVVDAEYMQWLAYQMGDVLDDDEELMEEDPDYDVDEW